MILLEYKSGRITFKKTFYKGKYKCFEVKCDCGKELTHSIDYKDYESYYNSNDYSVKILINQLLDEGHCAGNEEVCGASHYRYGTNENWIYK